MKFCKEFVLCVFFILALAPATWATGYIEGADINKKDKEGMTPLMHAARDYPTKESAEVIEVLIRAGAKVNEKDNNGMTPLMHAVWISDPSVVRVLMKHGADVNARTKDGKSALSIALTTRTYPNEEIETLLTRAGAKY